MVEPIDHLFKGNRVSNRHLAHPIGRLIVVPKIVQNRRSSVVVVVKIVVVKSSVQSFNRASYHRHRQYKVVTKLLYDFSTDSFYLDYNLARPMSSNQHFRV